MDEKLKAELLAARDVVEVARGALIILQNLLTDPDNMGEPSFIIAHNRLLDALNEYERIISDR